MPTNTNRSTLTSTISTTNEELTYTASEPLVPRSPTIRPEAAPRINVTDRHTCLITGSQALTEVEVLHLDPNCPNAPQRFSAPENL